ncbi:MAG: hypothetical protein V4649_18900 [Bacteroidota bacterium]
MRNLLLTLIACTSCILTANAQLAAFVDIQNQLMAWDRGMLRKIDFLAPVSIQTGRIAIPYLDNSRSFKIYYNGGVKPVNIGFTNAYFATDNLVAFLNQKSLNVFDKGVIKNLTGVCDQYFIGDSVILFLDAYKSAYKAYYNGQIINVENFIPDSVLAGIKVGDNVFAYNNFANQFRVFYRGNIIAQEDFPVISFDAGRNTVAYVDVNRKFKVFHSGQTIPLDDYTPKSFKVGDNVVAFVTADGYFKVFYNDSTYTIGYMGGSYTVTDNIVAFKDQSGYLKVFYKGEVYTLDNYYPNDLEIQYNSLAYVNANNTLRLFTEGETYDVTNAELTNWTLRYDVVSYQIGQGIFKVFYKGTEY